MAQRVGSKQRVLGAKRREEALQMRLRGMSYAAIGEALGVSKQAAHQHVHKALEDTAKKCAEDAEKIREIERERIDKMIDGLWDKATTGDVHAIQTMIKLQARRARMDGLDAPAKQQIGGDPDNPAPAVVLYLPKNGKGVDEQ